MKRSNGYISAHFEDSYGDTGDSLTVLNHKKYTGDELLRFLSKSKDPESIDVWLNRSQVQDLMVVVAFWLQETEEE